MATILSERAEALIEDLPPYFSRDRTVQAILQACAQELDLIETTAREIQDELSPLNATDTYGFLAMYEAFLGLPVLPPGVTEAQRRSRVVAFWRTHKSGSGESWVSRVTDVLDTTNWRHEEGPDPYEVTVYVPFEAGSYSVWVLQKALRAITPAHLKISIVGEGFIVGVSHIGEESL